jgi:hypothetical protein
MFFNPASEHVVIDTQVPGDLGNRDVRSLNQRYYFLLVFFCKSSSSLVSPLSGRLSTLIEVSVI